MNEQIKQLAFQAMSINQKVSDDNFFVDVSKLKEFEKFAELIVKRMIDNVECHAGLYDSPDIKFICEKIVNSIKFDFGIEE